MERARAKVNEKLLALANKTQRSVEKALTMVGIQVRGDAVMMAPVDTGLLRTSIEYKVEGAEYVEIGTSVEYAAFQEFGTSKMEAQPFLTPSVNQNREFIKAVLKNTIKEGLSE